MERFRAAPGTWGGVRDAGGSESGTPDAPPGLWRYGLAVGFVGVALAIKLVLDPLISAESPFLLFFGAVMAAALMGGFGPGLFATALSALLADYFFMSPLYSFGFGEELRLALFVSEGALIGVLVETMRSARRRAESDRRSLRESEERFRATFEQAAVGVAHLAPDGRWLSANGKLCEIVGYDEDELLRLTFQEITHPADLEAGLEHVDRLLAGEIGTYSLEKRYLRKDGSVVWAGLTVSLVRPQGTDEPGYLVAIVEDISARREADEALLKAEQRLREAREQERLRISHDLHDEVLSDLVYALQEARIVQSMSRNENAPPGGIETRLHETARTLQRSVEGLRRAIFDLRPKEDLERPLAHSLASLVELNRRMSRGRFEVDLRVEGAAVEAIPADPARELVRIIQEALNNARRHSEARHVRVRVAVEEDGVLRAEVADDGRGFRPERASGGVGISSMRERARQLGGEIEILSKPGAGAVVRFAAPIKLLQERERGTR